MFPASRAGIREFTRIKYGYCNYQLNTSLRIGFTYIPRKENQNWANRNLSNKPLEALLGLAICVLQSVLADLQKILSPHGSCSNFLRRVHNWSSHLLRKLLGQYILFAFQNIQSLLHNGLSLLQRGLAPVAKRFSGNIGELLEIGSRNAISSQDRLVRNRRYGSNRFDRHFAEFVEICECESSVTCPAKASGVRRA